MALLTDDIQDKLIKLLVNEGLIEQSVIDDAKQRANELKKPLCNSYQASIRSLKFLIGIFLR